MTRSLAEYNAVLLALKHTTHASSVSGRKSKERRQDQNGRCIERRHWCPHAWPPWPCPVSSRNMFEMLVVA
jgi:hypothetical protein